MKTSKIILPIMFAMLTFSYNCYAENTDISDDAFYHSTLTLTKALNALMAIPTDAKTAESILRNCRDEDRPSTNILFIAAVQRNIAKGNQDTAKIIGLVMGERFDTFINLVGLKQIIGGWEFMKSLRTNFPNITLINSELIS